MEKEVIISWLKKGLLKIIYWGVSLLIFFNAMIILYFHWIIPFFPILFLFNFCFWFCHPIFVKYVFKQKWYECTKDEYLALKYILIPSLVMEGIVLLYYYPVTKFAINIFMKGNG